MPRNWVARTVVLGLLSASAASCAAAEEATILAKLKQSMSHLTVARIAPSPVAGLYRVEVRGKGAVLYVTEDGSHLVAGDLYALTDSGLANVTEVGREAKRRELLASLPLAEQIVFAAVGERQAPPTPTPCPIRDLLAILPPKQRQTFRLRVLEDYTLREIANALHVPVGTVKSRLNIAVRHLRHSRRAYRLLH